MINEFDPDSESGKGLGKVVFSFSDIPQGKKYITANGNVLQRIDEDKLDLEGNSIIEPESFEQGTSSRLKRRSKVRRTMRSFYTEEKVEIDIHL